MKKALLGLALSCICCSGQSVFRAQNVSAAAGGGPTLITSTCQGLGSAGGTTTGINTTGANFIVGHLTWLSSGTGLSAVTDNKTNGNATLLTQSIASNQNTSRNFYWTNPTTGTGHTFSFTGTSVFASICIEAWSGMVTASVLDAGTDVVCSGGSPFQTTTTCQPNTSISPSTGKKVVIFGFGHEATSGTCSIDSSMTIDQQILTVGGTNYGGGIASIIQTPNGSAIQPIVTCPAASNPTGGIAAFKAL